MQLHELKPSVGSRHARKRLGRGTSSGQGKTAGKGTKVNWHDKAARHVLASKVARCHYSAGCQSAVSTTLTAKNMQSLTFPILIASMTVLKLHQQP